DGVERLAHCTSERAVAVRGRHGRKPVRIYRVTECATRCTPRTPSPPFFTTGCHHPRAPCDFPCGTLRALCGRPARTRLAAPPFDDTKTGQIGFGRALVRGGRQRS